MPAQRSSVEDCGCREPFLPSLHLVPLDMLYAVSLLV